MIVGIIIFSPDHHFNRTDHDLFTRKGDKNVVFWWWSVSFACFNKLCVDFYLYLFFKLYFILLSEKEKAATRQWKICQKIQGIQILMEYWTHFQCKPFSEIQRICQTILSFFSHISQNSSSKNKSHFTLFYMCLLCM